MSERNAWKINAPGTQYHEQTIFLLTVPELKALRKTVVVSISGDESECEKADDDTRFGYTAWGLPPRPPAEKEKRGHD